MKIPAYLRNLLLFSIFIEFLLFSFPRPSAADTLTVINNNNSGAGSLRQAIADADPGDTIVFDSGVTGTIALSTGALIIDKNLIITGPGASALAISGSQLSQVLRIESGNVVISALTVKNGQESNSSGGGIFNNGNLTLDSVVIMDNATLGDSGGGISNNDGAILSITNSTVTGNSAAGGIGGGIHNFLGSLTVDRVTVSGNESIIGGGICSQGGTFSLTNSTISGNTITTSNSGGGGIAVTNNGQATLVNVTISDNQILGTNTIGGGFGSQNGATATLINVTITDNSAMQGGGVGNFNAGTSTLINSIVADNPVGGDCNFAITDGGHNIFGDSTCNFMTGVDPILGLLTDNGGPTETHALLFGSPAINTGDDASCPATDQRGVARQGICDIGAYEFVPDPGSIQFSAADYVVAEGGGAVVITITRTGGSDGPVSVDFSTSDGTAAAGEDYTAVNQTVSFADGDMADKTVTVQANEDDFDEGDQTVNLTLSDPTGGAVLGSPNQAVLTITEPLSAGSPDEVCNNNTDDDGDGDVDCDDSDCSLIIFCQDDSGQVGNAGGCSLEKGPGSTSGDFGFYLLLLITGMGFQRFYFANRTPK
jgi:hypothetical protein